MECGSRSTSSTSWVRTPSRASGAPAKGADSDPPEAPIDDWKSLAAACGTASGRTGSAPSYGSRVWTDGSRLTSGRFSIRGTWRSLNRAISMATAGHGRNGVLGPRP